MSFDALAPHYRWMEFVLAGDKLQRCRTAFLDQIEPPRDVLILGQGVGRFLVECRRQWPGARITCLDSSSRMLTVARGRLRRAGLADERVTFLHADVLTWSAPQAAADLIVTHFFLDCFRPDQLEQIVPQLAHAARPAASWLLADFQVPAAGPLRWRACLMLKAMYAFFQRVTQLPANRLTAPDDFIRRNGFKLRQRYESEWGLLRSDHWEKLESTTGG
ncbi:MAG TPA: class I SAM-dependent methyltransferase [Verrucomicrobiae bacterium]|nr:class I SAM-dependent methyltransferase [Verrucomicrobiae bacterium]